MRHMLASPRIWQTLKDRQPSGDQGASPIGTAVALCLLLAVGVLTLGWLQSRFSFEVLIAVLGLGGFVVLLVLGLARR
ncbi:hypothetical protein ACFYPC_34090 [Streptomyces sp. NPDC005808]|uniref:hypothetical protein n=1 Tax=Streptomyces sp. NPDC005808 TaxID=3364734 RepID=UPI00367E5C29